MSNIKRLFLALFVALSCISQEAKAVKAYPHPITVTQPDGTRLTVIQHGDESFHYATSSDGYLLMKDALGFYCYANYDFATGRQSISKYRAHNIKERDNAEIGFVSSLKQAKVISADIRSRNTIKSKAPATIVPTLRGSKSASGMMRVAPLGECQYLVILVNFQDSTFRYTNKDFTQWLNEPGYAVNGSTGSVKDYYRDNSMGQYVPNFQVVGPYTLSQPLAYYGGNTSDTYEDQNPRAMVQEACELAKAANPDLNFAQFDNDGDGEMDNCYIIYAGYSEASTANDDDLWPHSWYMDDDNLIIDGIKIKNYSCSAELVGMPGLPASPTMDGIGTFTHEFGHILGLKDLYDTDDNTGGYGIDPGSYSLYASGSYNNDSRTPPCLWAFERMQLGWIGQGNGLKELNDAEDVTLETIAENKACYINAQPQRADGTGHEWFLLENRQQQGWDKYIPAHGLLIYHYDYTSEMQEKYWSVNGPNNNSKHRCLYIKAADGQDDNNSRPGDTYPGSSANTEFTDYSTPSALNWNGETTGIPVTNIVESNGKIMFQVKGGTSIWNSIRTNVPSDVRDTTATFTADILSHNSEVKEIGFCWSMSTDEPDITNTHATASTVENATFTVSNLQPGCNYNVRAYMVMADESVVYGSAVPFCTECMSSGAPFYTDFTSWTNNTLDCWNIIDHNGDGTSWVYDESTEAILYQYDYWNDADDWLICKRRLHIPEHGTLYIMRGVSEASTIEKLDIYVSTKSSDINDFFIHEKLSFADNFNTIAIDEIDLSQYAGQDIYIALKCSSEKLQNNLWIWGIYVMDKLGTPEITRFEKTDGDKLTVEWTPIDNAYYYYLSFGRETDEPNYNVVFAPMSFFENPIGDIEFSVGSAAFASDGSFELKTIPAGLLDCKFLVTTSGPFGTSELTVEGTQDGKNWTVVGPRITLSEYDNEGQECD
ncbi:MAG: M6 family metalloprotease domain-containing protein, partial [Prevotella sp.]